MPGFFENWIRKLCEKTVARLLAKHPRAYRLIPPRGDIYLARYYLYPPKDPVFDAQQREREEAYRPSKKWQLHLHHFYRSDADRELHNHPFEWSLSLILTGGYREERRVTRMNGYTTYFVQVRKILPFRFNFIRAGDFHRVDLLDEENGCWTLFLTGPRVQDWGFWNRNSGEFTPWRRFNVKQSRRNYDEEYARGLRGNGIEAAARSADLNWIPEDHADEGAPWNGDEEAFEKD